MIIKPLIAIILSATTYATLPPSAYIDMKNNAPEVVTIVIEKVHTVNRELGDKDVTIEAKIIDIEHSRSKLKRGDHITIEYLSFSYTQRP